MKKYFKIKYKVYSIHNMTCNDNDNDNDKVFYSNLIIHFIFNTAIDVFAY